MTKKIQNIAIIAICLLGLWLLLTAITWVKADWDSKEIADLEYRMNELRKQKEKCFNDLTYEESKQSFLWYTKPCVWWDEQIMEIREKADSLKAKSYEVGLDVNR